MVSFIFCVQCLSFELSYKFRLEVHSTVSQRYRLNANAKTSTRTKALKRLYYYMLFSKNVRDF